LDAGANFCPFSLLQYSWKRLASELGLPDREVLVSYHDVDDLLLARWKQRSSVLPVPNLPLDGSLHGGEIVVPTQISPAQQLDFGTSVTEQRDEEGRSTFAARFLRSSSMRRTSFSSFRWSLPAITEGNGSCSASRAWPTFFRASGWQMALRCHLRSPNDLARLRARSHCLGLLCAFLLSQRLALWWPRQW
jgi:hypothetical protein